MSGLWVLLHDPRGYIPGAPELGGRKTSSHSLLWALQSAARFQTVPGRGGRVENACALGEAVLGLAVFPSRVSQASYSTSLSLYLLMENGVATEHITCPAGLL